MKLPTNISIDLFRGDPTKGHEDWLCEISFTDPDTQREVRRKVDNEHIGAVFRAVYETLEQRDPATLVEIFRKHDA